MQEDKGIDTQVEGLTSRGPVTEVSPIDLNPWGQYVPPTNPTDPGELFFQQFTVTTTTQRLGFPSHEHIILANQGANTIQASKDGSTWFDFLPAGRIATLDGHKENILFVKTTAATSVLFVTTW